MLQGAEAGRALSGRGQHRNRFDNHSSDYIGCTAHLSSPEANTEKIHLSSCCSKTKHYGTFAKQFSEKHCKRKTQRTGPQREKSLINMKFFAKVKYIEKMQT